MRQSARFQLGALVLAAALLLQACASAQRVNQASDVAREGVELTTVLPGFYDAYYRSAIRADSVTLELVRRGGGMPPEMLREQLEQSNTDLLQTAALLQGMKEHVALLREYFQTIGKLTDRNVGEDLGSATNDLVDGMAAVRAELPDRNALDIPLDKAAKPAGNFVVVALKSRALREELEAHGAAIDAELAAQETVLRALAESMASNQEAWVTAGLKAPLFESYESTKGALPEGWVNRRVEFLTQPAKIETAMQAEKAMAELRLAWRQLAGGGPEATTLIRLQNRIDATQQLVAALAR